MPKVHLKPVLSLQTVRLATAISIGIEEKIWNNNKILCTRHNMIWHIIIVIRQVPLPWFCRPNQPKGWKKKKTICSKQQPKRASAMNFCKQYALRERTSAGRAFYLKLADAMYTANVSKSDGTFRRMPSEIFKRFHSLVDNCFCQNFIDTKRCYWHYKQLRKWWNFLKYS